MTSKSIRTEFILICCWFIALWASPHVRQHVVSTMIPIFHEFMWFPIMQNHLQNSDSHSNVSVLHEIRTDVILSSCVSSSSGHENIQQDYNIWLDIYLLGIDRTTRKLMQKTFETSKAAIRSTYASWWGLTPRAYHQGHLSVWSPAILSLWWHCNVHR